MRKTFVITFVIKSEKKLYEINMEENGEEEEKERE